MREQLLEGKLEYPGSAIFDKYPEEADTIASFWKAVWYNFLNDQETNGVYWYDKLGAKIYNDVVRRLCHHGWVISRGEPGRKWATVKLRADKLLDYLEVDEIEQVRAQYKYNKYLLECRDAKASTLVRQNGKTKRTGLVRTGFRDAGNTQFGYDMAKLKEYETAVKKNLTKSMDKIRKEYPEMQCDDASYDNVSVGIFDWYDYNRYETFTTGDSISDSRGRAISQGLKKVANPISSKDFRAALVITYDE
jgi:hypothetical protein